MFICRMYTVVLLPNGGTLLENIKRMQDIFKYFITIMIILS